jgi:NitT/TauT family transport system substrate-binding protein
VLTPLGGITNVNSSLMAGSIAAAASHPPATYEFQRAGFVDLIDLAKEKIPSVSAGIWITEDYDAAHHATVQGLVSALVEAIRREKSDQAYAESEMSKHLGISDQAQLDFTYDFYVNEVLQKSPTPRREQIQSNIDALSASNPRVKDVDPSGMIDEGFVNNAERQQATGDTGAALAGGSQAHAVRK